MMLKKLVWAGAVIVAIVVVGYAATKISPWPSALFFRWVMDQGGIKAAHALDKHVPPGVAAQLNQQYDPDNRDARLDVFYPAALGNSGQTQPTIVWVHGGAFLSGSKDQIANYLKILAAKPSPQLGLTTRSRPVRIIPPRLFRRTRHWPTWWQMPPGFISILPGSFWQGIRPALRSRRSSRMLSASRHTRVKWESRRRSKDQNFAE
jgi:Carboxylesterase family